jgi:hypothetical protein
VKFQFVVVILFVVCLSVSDTRAGSITPIEASAMIQGTATDLDIDMLTEFAGLQPAILHSDSIIDLSASTWTETLGSVYGVTPLSVNYSGDFSAFPGGAITWTSAGTFGADAWTGSGSATITEDSATAFHVDISTTLSVGANSGTNSLTIFGSISPTELAYTDNTTGTTTVNGIQKRPRRPSLIHFRGDPISIWYTDNRATGVIEDVSRLSEEDIGTRTSRMHNDYYFTPEPSSLLLWVGLGCFAARGACRRKMTNR